ncbi:MAG: protein kinase [Vicinamibacteria bacterium]
MTTARNPLPPPRALGEYRVGRYRVRARLGKGGMGVVYLGRDEALDRDVAIKTLRVDGTQDDESRGRFEIEAKAAARLQHPNIVTVFELGEDRGLPYIAMELLGGQDLETLLRSGERLGVIERLDIVIQTLRGLEFAHTHQIVHRDIKPSNIRVLDDGGVKILDFGIAKVESTSVTRAGMMVGTPYYMSPEHIRGGVLDGRSDVFAVGVILHELFAGARPFVAEDSTRVLYRIVNEAHSRLDPKAAGPLTADIQRVIDKSLEKNADDRFTSATQMADELTRVRDRYPVKELNETDSSALSRARKSLASRHVESDTLQSVERIAHNNPDSSEAQRLLRLIKRKPEEPHSVNVTGSFPELDATFGRAEGGDVTVASGKTISGSAATILRGPAPSSVAAFTPPAESNNVLYAAVVICLVTGAAAGGLYLKQRTTNAPPDPKPTPAITEIIVPASDAVPQKRPGATPAAERPGSVARVPVAPTTSTNPGAAKVPVPGAAVEIRSQPAGAAIRIDRKAAGVTPLKTELTTTGPHVISFSLAGYQSKDVRVDLPIPSTLNETLSPEGPPSTLIVESGYPVTVSVDGRVIASDKPGLSATVSSGSHDVVIESAAVFLRRKETVQLGAGGSFTLKAPGTGKIGVRANPDNCKVFVDGVFVDYPPILDRVIAAGNHVVSFEWPDGSKSEEKVEVQAGRPSYVMGHKR